MKTIEYTITDPLGIHARPAAMLAKLAGKFNSSVKLAKAEKEIDAKRIMSLMGLAVKQDDTVVLTVEGEDESEAAAALEEFLRETL